MAAEDEPPSISQIELVRNSTKKKLSIEEKSCLTIEMLIN